MQKNSITPTPVNKVQIVLTKKKMTAYGGFALIAAFFRQIGFAQMIEHALPVIESSPNGMGIYGKVIAYAAMVYAGAERFSHLVYLGNKDVLATVFGASRLPAAATTLTRLFNRVKSLNDAETLSLNVWTYSLSPGRPLVKTGLRLIPPYSSGLEHRKGQRKATILPNMAGRAIVPFSPSSTGANT